MCSQISSSRQELVRELFWHAADDDYICARLSARNALYRHFSWNASQSLEKYTKCIILLQGGNAKFGHNFHRRLKDDVIDQNSNEFPEYLDISNTCKVCEKLREYARESLISFVKRIEAAGHTEGRYRKTNNLVKPYDLQKLDLVVMFLRRLCAPAPCSLHSKNEHDRKLDRDPEQVATNLWPTVQYSTRDYKDKWNALRFENCANFPELYDSSTGWFFGSWASAPQVAMEVTSRASQQDLDWLRENIK